MAVMNVDVVDGTGTDDVVRHDRQDLYDQDPVRANTVGQTVRDILTRVGDCHIRRLRIFAHGGPGEQGLGRSEYSDPSNPRLDPATHSMRLAPGSTTQVENEQHWAQLRGKFAHGGWVELHGCQVARGVRGYFLLRRLSDLWGVPVKAGIQNQARGGGLEGGLLVAWPNGRVEGRPPRD